MKMKSPIPAGLALPLWIVAMCFALPARSASADTPLTENEKNVLMGGTAASATALGAHVHQSVKASRAQARAHQLHVRSDGLRNEAYALESGKHPIPSLGYDGEKVLAESKNHDRGYLRGKLQAPLKANEIREALDRLEKRTPKDKVISLSYTPVQIEFVEKGKPLRWVALPTVHLSGPAEEVLAKIRRSIAQEDSPIARIAKHPTTEDRMFAAAKASTSAEFQHLMKRSEDTVAKSVEEHELSRRLGRRAVGAGVASWLLGIPTLSAGVYYGVRDLTGNAAVSEKTIKELATEQTLTGDAPPAPGQSGGGKLN